MHLNDRQAEKTKESVLQVKQSNVFFKLIPFIKCITGTIKTKIVAEFIVRMYRSSRGIHQIIHGMSLYCTEHRSVKSELLSENHR